MRQRQLRGNIAILVVFSMIFSSLFGLMPFKVHAATISDANGEHCFGDYFTYLGGTGKSNDNFYKVTPSKYTISSDNATCAWISDDNNADQDSVYITVTNSGELGSFELVSVDVGEFNDGNFSNVYIEGYSNGQKIFTTTPFNDGQTQYLEHYNLDCSSALGKYIDSFRIYCTKGAGVGYGLGDFSFYSFTTSNATRDNTPPSSPIVLGITDDTGVSASDGITNDNTPTFSGTAEADSTVTLYNGSIFVDRTTADTSGAWRITTPPLAEGTYNFTATATDIADNVSSPSAIKTIAIDKTAPSQTATPVLDTASDTGVSNSDGITNDNTPTIKGTAEANSTVSLYNGSTLVTTASADTSGAWSITTPTLLDGVHSFTTTATDKAGNVSTTSSALSVTIDTVKPAMPSVTSITTDTGTSSSDGITYDTTLCFNGTADANIKVELLIDGVSVGSTTTDTAGNWSYDHTGVQLTNGSHTVVATATDTAGNISDTSAPFTFNIDSATPTITSITPPADGTYNYGQTLTFAVTFSEAVTVSGGAPSIGITLDGKTATAQYESGSGTSKLTFRYTIGTGDFATASGISLASTINLNGSTIKDIAGNNASLTINNAPSTENIKVDSTPVVTLSASNTSMAENGGTTDIVATLSNPASKAVKIMLDYSGTATNGNDYNSITEINIPSGSTTAQIEISSIDDKIYEGNENIIVSIASVTNAYGSGAQTLTINDDEGKPTVTLTTSALSFSENGGTCDVTAKLSNKSAYPVTVTLAFSGTAKVDRDYTTSAAIVTVPAGSTSASITLTGINNSIDEDDKTLVVDITGVTEGTEDGSQSIALSVTDDDAAPSFSVGDTSVLEGDSGIVSLKYTVTLSSISSKVVTIHYATEDGTATGDITSPASSDYKTTSGTLTFAPGDTSKEVTVLVNGDYTSEPNETVLLKLSNGSNTSNTTAQAIGTILNDDDPELILGGTSSLSEGTGTNKGFSFTVTLTKPSSNNISVDFTTEDVTAKAGKDYVATGGSIIFAPGETSKTIDVEIIGDSIDENDETFRVTISNPSPSSISIKNSGATCTITDDDTAPIVSIGNTTVTEGNSDATSAELDVTLSDISEKTITVNYATLDGTAIAGSDYITTNSSITFAPGVTQQAINIDVTGDATDEENEIFGVVLSSPTNVTISTTNGTGTVTIADDDAAPSFSVGDTSISEGDDTSSSLTYTIKLSAPSGKTVNIYYATEDGTATGDITSPASSDYKTTSGTLTFAPGDTSKEVTVLVNGDYTSEPNETVLLKLSNGSNTSNTTAQAIGTILNDDDPELILGGTSSLSEGTGTNKGFSFTVTLTKPSSNNISVDFTTEDVTAKAGKDYVATGGSIIFAPGETSKTIDVEIIGDSIDENDETFRVTISNPSPSSISIKNSGATCTITDDDTAPIVSIGNTTVTEGNSDATSAELDVTLSDISEKTITVNYATLDGTAIAGSDYITTNSSITFAPGVTQQAIVVDIKGDTVDEYDETLGLELSSPTNATISTTNGIGTATITDDDAAPSFSVEDTSVLEGDSGTVSLKYTVTLSSSSGKEVTIHYATEDGTATADIASPALGDYMATSGTLNFAPGDTSREVTVLVNGDYTSEPNETILLKLSNGSNTSNTTAQAIGTIYNDDGPTISILGNSVVIMNGDITPSAIDNTDFGSVSVNGGTQTRIFTISNTGFDTLTLTGAVPYIILTGEGATDFSVSTSPASINIANGDSITFAITFNPSSVGTKNANITIASNDIFSSPYTFSIKGTGYYQNDSSQVSPKPGAIVIVNGQSQSIAEAETLIVNGRTVTTITIDDKKMEEQLDKAGQNTIIQIPIANSSDVSVGVLNAQVIKNMQEKDAVLEIKTGNITYTLPASQINIGSIASMIGSSVELRDIRINVSISASPDNTVRVVEDTANKNRYQIVVKPIDFDIACTSGGKTVEVSKFNGYVERTVAIPDGVDPSKITTGVVLNKDGSFSHVPTHVFSINGKYYAKINSLTNSTYSLIYNDVKFKDVEGHWAKNSVNEIASRLIDSGVGEGTFAPDRAITRAEFASMIAKALGLKATKFDNIFTDVDKDSQYYQYIYAAYEYGITDGCGKGKFAPNAQITRQDAMTMIARAMKLTKLDTSISNEDIVKQLKSFSDTAGISSYAKQGVALCIKNGIFSGNNAKLTPKENYTRAESAVVILRLLKKANLI